MKDAVMDLTRGSGGATYEVHGECTNCGWVGTLRLPNGTMAPAPPFDQRRCAACGCKAVVRSRP